MKNVIASALLCAAVAGAAHARGGIPGEIVIIGPFPLTPGQEVPPVTSPASGSARLAVNSVTGAFILDYEFSGLTTPLVAAHFHIAPPGQTGAPVFWLAPPGAPSPELLMDPPIEPGLRADSGSGTGTLTQEQLAALFAGNLYMNVHSEQHPTGEIRGQVIPAVGAIAPLAVGVVGFALRRRR